MRRCEELLRLQFQSTASCQTTSARGVIARIALHLRELQASRATLSDDTEGKYVFDIASTSVLCTCSQRPLTFRSLHELVKSSHKGRTGAHILA